MEGIKVDQVVLTENQKKYIRENCDLLSTKALAELLGVDYIKVYRYCQHHRLKLIQQGRAKDIKVLTDKQMEYINENHTKMSPTKMAGNINSSYYMVCKYCMKKKLSMISHRTGRITTHGKENSEERGIFNVNKMENWLVC